MPESADRRGMPLPHAAWAARLNVPTAAASHSAVQPIPA